jgi:iron complex transport system substrate-binding protein
MAGDRKGRARRPRWLIGAVLLAAAAVETAAAASCPRIVSQSPYLTHTLRWLGLAECIVGASRYGTLGVTATGGVTDPDYAAIAVLEPDLMLTSDWTNGEQWRQRAPEGTRALVLDGFESMAGIAENLRLIGEAAGLDRVGERVAAFRRGWQRRADAVAGNGRRVLLLSACSGHPYSFGRRT